MTIGLALALVGPVVTGRAPAAAATIVNPDSAIMERGTSVEVFVLANDEFDDPGPVTLGIRSAPATGAATVEDPDGTGPEPARIRYAAALHASAGEDWFEYEVSAGGQQIGTAEVSIEVRNAPPTAADDTAQVVSATGAEVAIAVLANDADPDGGVLEVDEASEPSHGTAEVDGDAITYAPEEGYVGRDEFEYSVTDGQGGSDAARVVVTVLDPTKPVTLHPDTFTATSGAAQVLDVLANDDAGDRGPLRIRSAGPSSAGATVELGTDALTLTYTAPAAFSGADTFGYVVVDRLGHEATGQVAVTVSSPAPASEPPAPAPVPEPAPAPAPNRHPPRPRSTSRSPDP